MSQTAKKGLILAVIAVVAVAGVAWRVTRGARKPQVREIAGATITKLDPATKTAEIEFLHQKTGRDIKIAGKIAPDCQILINDQPAAFGDLKVGDVATVKGVQSGYSVEAQSVRVRRGAAQTQPLPATRPVTSRP